MRIIVEIDIPDLENRIIRAMLKRRISYRALAKVTGVSHNHLVRVVGSKSAVSIDVLKKIADGLNINLFPPVKKEVLRALREPTRTRSKDAPPK